MFSALMEAFLETGGRAVNSQVSQLLIEMEIPSDAGMIAVMLLDEDPHSQPFISGFIVAAT